MGIKIFRWFGMEINCEWKIIHDSVEPKIIDNGIIRIIGVIIK